MKKWIIWLGGALLGLALLILGRDGRALKRTENARDEDLQGRIGDNLQSAEKSSKKAQKQRENAKLAADKVKQVLEARSEQDPDMAHLLSDWKSRRVRERSDTGANVAKPGTRKRKRAKTARKTRSS
jgi:hypothetical protein